MEHVYGVIYSENKFRKGYLGFEDGVIKTSGKTIPEGIKNKATAKGLIIPTFFNSHIHLADSFLFGKFSNETVKSLVEPKTGLKIKKLKEESDRTIIQSNREIIMDMVLSGTSGFIDFRELGLRGIKNLKKSLEDIPVDCRILGRPYDVKFDPDELKKILKISDGIGLSAYRDWHVKWIKRIVAETKKKSKLFALHVSETVRESIDEIIELQPNFLVHMLKATKTDLKKVAENNIPVVVCPRANMFYGKYPNINAMVEAKVKLLVGTDNSMITIPDMLREMEFMFRIAKLKGGISPETMMEIFFRNPNEIFENDPDLSRDLLGEGSASNFIVLNVPKLSTFAHPENLLCLGLAREQIDLISMKKFVWRRLK